jgi:hypothetical protein
VQFFLLTAAMLNFLIGYGTFRVFSKRRYLFSDRFGYTLASTASTVTSLAFAVNVYLLTSGPMNAIGGLILLCSAGIGILFGSMVNAQTVIAGVFNGGIGGIMGIMLGAVALDPSLCGLPMTFFTEQAMVFFFTLLSLILHFISACLL